MPRVNDPVLYLTSWDDAGIVKFGFTNRNRWRGFHGARLVVALLFASAMPGYDFELLVNRAASRAWPAAFRSREEAVPYLAGKGGGYLECHRATANDAMELLASQCDVTMQRHTVTSQCHVTVPRHGPTDRQTDEQYRDASSRSPKNSSYVTRARGEKFS